MSWAVGFDDPLDIYYLNAGVTPTHWMPIPKAP